MTVPKAQWLSASEREFLARHFEEAMCLHLGELKPASEVASEFIEVLQGRRSPTRALEFLYLRFLGERGLHRNDPTSRVRLVQYCSKCGNKRDLNRVLWTPETKLCQGCQPESLKGRKLTRPVRKVEQSKQPKTPKWSSDSIPWAQRFAPTRPERPKLYVKGGFADYDFDSISPHGIPRKKRD